MAKKKSPDELTFWDHLDELRIILFRLIIVWIILAIGYFIAMPYLFDQVILAPCHDDFIFYSFLKWIGEVFHLKDDFFTQEFHVSLININLAAPFFIHISTALWMSVVTTVPYLLYEVWKFISPALYQHERRGVKKALGIGTVMFFLGVLVGYFMVYPLTLRFLSTYQLSSTIVNQISLNSYIDNFMVLVLCMGLAFELPLVTWLLSVFGIINRDFLRKYRRHAVVIIVVVAAIITPTGDPFTLTAVSLPLYLLYELSILMIKNKEEKC
ncbi:twin-arginine translocase subunit TatC [Bacteroides sp. 224]|uniref:twin-arginine translocase subunit TatC n=1 Tax=Bacteroides sp. 224 TaxID=2302936 RepID=UPI0013CFE9D6|nr:twin-arginine translocase subunit TatC [Bacteroides sp. 224]NDV67017.1 twin-arginine translocase subunit TatC [Bacteroides sp. 224]